MNILKNFNEFDSKIILYKKIESNILQIFTLDASQ